MDLWKCESYDMSCVLFARSGRTTVQSSIGVPPVVDLCQFLTFVIPTSWRGDPSSDTRAANWQLPAWLWLSS
eukprot:3277854-Amphidinium_carterae.1